MDYSLARNKTMSLYNEFAKTQDPFIYESLKNDEVQHIYYALINKIDHKNHELLTAFGQFLYFAIRRYDRFSEPRKRDNDDMRSKYHLLLNALKKLDKGTDIFSWYAQMNNLRWDVYHECANHAMTPQLMAYIDTKIDALEKIHNRKFHPAVELFRTNLRNFFLQMKTGMSTIIETSLPYTLTPKDSSFHLTYDGIEVDVKIKNTLTDTPLPLGIQISEGSTINEILVSKNSYSKSKLTLDFHCFIDEGIDLESVSFSEDESFSWNYLYDFTYKVIRMIWSYLQSLGEDYVTWPPLPQDIGTINWKVKCGERAYDEGILTNPATGFQISSANRGVLHHVIKDGFEMSWSDNALYYARLYAKAGQFEETIFWINVAVEALIDEFLKRIAPDENVYQELTDQENKFQSAEEILRAQYPEMAGKVKWPTSKIKASVYSKIKRSLTLIDKKSEIKIVQDSYSKINKKRNNLFHGNKQDIGVSDLTDIFKSYYKIKSILDSF